MKRMFSALIAMALLTCFPASAMDCSRTLTAKLCSAIGGGKTICRVITVGRTCDADGKSTGEFLNAAVSFPDRGGLIHDVHETLACTRLEERASCSGMRQVSEAGNRSLPTFFKRGEVPDWFYAKNMPKKGEQVACVQEQDLSKPSSVAINERAVLEMKHPETAVLESGAESPSVDEIIRVLRKAGNLPPCLYRM